MTKFLFLIFPNDVITLVLGLANKVALVHYCSITKAAEELKKKEAEAAKIKAAEEKAEKAAAAKKDAAAKAEAGTSMSVYLYPGDFLVVELTNFCLGLQTKRRRSLLLLRRRSRLRRRPPKTRNDTSARWQPTQDNS